MNKKIIEKQKYVTNTLTNELRAVDSNIKSVVYSVTADNEEFICVFFRNGTKKFVGVTDVCRENLCRHLLGNIK